MLEYLELWGGCPVFELSGFGGESCGFCAFFEVFLAKAQDPAVEVPFAQSSVHEVREALHIVRSAELLVLVAN